MEDPENQTLSKRPDSALIVAATTAGHVLTRMVSDSLVAARAAAIERSGVSSGESRSLVQNGEKAYADERFDEAFGLFSKAAAAGDPIALFWIGKCHFFGKAVEENHVQAAHWYRKAADLGSRKAEAALGECYEYGQGVTKDIAEAAKWFRLAIEHGEKISDETCRFFAEHFDDQRDYSEAVQWYRLAAERGDANAMLMLGHCHYHGRGVLRDYAAAVNCYRLAAASGEPFASYWLGLCVLRGDGVTQDFTAAAVLFRDAANLGVGNARFELGRCYFSGLGVARDWPQSYRWLTLADGLTDDYLSREKCEKIESMIHQMSTSDVSAGKALLTPEEVEALRSRPKPQTPEEMRNALDVMLSRMGSTPKESGPTSE